MDKLKKMARISGSVLIGVIVVGVLFHTGLNVYANLKIAAEIKKVRQRGEPVTLEELAGLPIPDEQNAIPLYQEAFDRIGKYQNTLNTYAERTSKDYSHWTLEDQEGVRAILAPLDDTFDIIHQASLRPDYWIDVSQFWRNKDYAFTSHFGRAVRLLSLKAAVEKADEKMEKAIETVLDGFAMARAVGCVRGLMSSLIRLASDTIMLNRLENFLTDQEIAPETYERLYATLREQQKSLNLDFVGERCISYSLVAEQSYLRHPFLKLSSVGRLKAFTFMSQLAKEPYWEVGETSQPQGIYIGFVRRMTNERAKHGAAEIAVALRMYRNQHGHYPTSLSDLVPSIVTELPVDPFTGKDFGYRLEGEGFVVYSVGANKVDERGLLEDSRDVGWRFSQ